MTSSVKPEVHTYHSAVRGRTTHGNVHKNSVKLCERTDRQTDRQTILLCVTSKWIVESVWVWAYAVFARRLCPVAMHYVNMETSTSTKPEVHKRNALSSEQLNSQPQAACTKNIVKFGHAVFEICLGQMIGKLADWLIDLRFLRTTQQKYVIFGTFSTANLLACSKTTKPNTAKASSTALVNTKNTQRTHAHTRTHTRTYSENSKLGHTKTKSKTKPYSSELNR